MSNDFREIRKKNLQKLRLATPDNSDLKIDGPTACKYLSCLPSQHLLKEILEMDGMMINLHVPLEEVELYKEFCRKALVVIEKLAYKHNVFTKNQIGPVVAILLVTPEIEPFRFVDFGYLRYPKLKVTMPTVKDFMVKTKLRRYTNQYKHTNYRKHPTQKPIGLTYRVLEELKHSQLRFVTFLMKQPDIQIPHFILQYFNSDNFSKQ